MQFLKSARYTIILTILIFFIIPVYNTEIGLVYFGGVLYLSLFLQGLYNLIITHIFLRIIIQPYSVVGINSSYNIIHNCGVGCSCI